MRKRRELGWFLLAGAVLVVDQATKALVLARLMAGETIAVTAFFNLVRVMNPGASFSFLANAGGWQRWFFTALALVVSAWLAMMIRRHAHERLQPAAFALIMGGALGNALDRLRFGAVVDFLDFYYAGWHWPAFNLADAAITLGVGLLLLHPVFARRRP